MSKLTINIPLAVVPKQGDRSRIVQPRNGKPFIHHYQPEEVVQSVQMLTALLQPRCPPKPLEGALRLLVDVDFPWRRSESKKCRALGRIPKDTKPDYDNLAKQVGDVMEKLGFFTNDAQIADARVRKWWSDSPRLAIELETIHGQLQPGTNDRGAPAQARAVVG